MRRDPIELIQQLQGWRGRAQGDLSIARLVEAASESATRIHRRLGELITLWRDLMPVEVVDRTVLAGLRNGVLTVLVDSAATAFEVDRLLRGGIESHLRQQFRGTLIRVKTRVDALEPSAASSPTARLARAKTAKTKAAIAPRVRRR